LRCFACDKDLTAEIVDRPTNRYYCVECFEPTIDEMLRLLELEDREQMADPRKRFMDTGEVETIYPELIDNEGNILDIENLDDEYDHPGKWDDERDRYAMLDEDY
jgi:hypothetical protein